MANLQVGVAGNGTVTVGAGASVHSPASNTLTLGTNDDERLRIDSTGRLLKSGQAALTSTSLSHSLQVAAASDANAIAIFGRAADDIGELSFYEADKSTKLGELQLRTNQLNLRARTAGADINFATVPSGGSLGDKMTIKADGKVGIGEASPDSLLHLTDSTDGGASESNLISISRRSGGANDATIRTLHDGSDGISALILKFATNERVRITSAGDIHSASSVQSGGNASSGYKLSSVDTACNLQIQGKSAANGGSATNAVFQGWFGDQNTFRVNSDGTIKTSKGIDFSGAQTNDSGMTSELLDSYEEGTFTPTYMNVSVTTYGHRSGRYTKIGRLVYCVGQITVDGGLDNTDGSAINIGGLPFSGNADHAAAQMTLGQYTNIMTQTSLDSFTNVRFSSNQIMLYEGSNTNLSYNGCNATGTLQFAITYAM